MRVEQIEGITLDTLNCKDINLYQRVNYYTN